MALRLSHLIGVCISDTHGCCSLLLLCIRCAVLHNIYSTVLTIYYSARIRTGKVTFLSLSGGNLYAEVILTSTVSCF